MSAKKYVNFIGLNRPMIKRIFDIIASICGLILIAPILLPVMLLIWLQDLHSPFYVASRMAKDGGKFRMVKLRSMMVDSDKTNVNSTAANDQRITPVGRFIRNIKLDELVQMWNVLKGDMSFVGPRPQVETDASLYTEVENRMLTVRPGITDISSIVFSDEGEILAGSDNPDLKYNQVIRPWKSRLALLYIEHQSFWLDLQLIWLTILAIASRARALKKVSNLLNDFEADDLLIRITQRKEPLFPYPPPGATEVVATYP